MSVANPSPDLSHRCAGILPRAWRAAAWPAGIGLALLAMAGCVAVGQSGTRDWPTTVAAVGSAPGERVTIATDDDRLTTPPAAPPGAWPRVEPIRSGAPNLPYVIGEERYVPIRQDVPMRQTGIASWYGEPFHGRLTANGEVYDMDGMTAAHPTMPLPSYALVRHVASGREVLVRVNDRGPFVGGRVIDLSRAAAQRLGIEGIARVEVVRLTHDDIRQGRWLDPAVRLASADTLTRP